MLSAMISGAGRPGRKQEPCRDLCNIFNVILLSCTDDVHEAHLVHAAQATHISWPPWSNLVRPA